MASFEALRAFFDSADFKFDLILQHLNALDGDGDRTVFRCLFQRSATSKSLSFDCNKKHTIQAGEEIQFLCLKLLRLFKGLPERILVLEKDS